MEGILVRAADELMALQEERKVHIMYWLFCCLLHVFSSCDSFTVYSCALQKVDPEMAEALDQFLVKLRSFAAGEVPFTFILDDPAGNSFIENP